MKIGKDYIGVGCGAFKLNEIPKDITITTQKAFFN